MTNQPRKTCKTKWCKNPAIVGKYCVMCTQKRKEMRGKILAGAGAVGIPAAGYAIKKGALKQLPKIAAKLAQILLKR